MRFEFRWKWNAKAVLSSSLCGGRGAGLPSAGVPGAGDRNHELHHPNEFLSNGVRTPIIVSDFTAGVCSFWGRVPLQSLVNK